MMFEVLVIIDLILFAIFVELITGWGWSLFEKLVGEERLDKLEARLIKKRFGKNDIEG